METNPVSGNKNYLPTPRQMGFGELLDTTFSLYRAHFLQFLAIVSAYFFIIMFAGAISFLRIPLTRGNWLAIWIPILLAILCICIVVVSGLVSATSQSYVYGEIKKGEALKRGIKRFFPCLFGLLLYCLLASIVSTISTLPLVFFVGTRGSSFWSVLVILVLGLLSLIVFLYVTFYCLSYWYFLIAAVLIEGKSMREGMRRRRELVRQKSNQIVWTTIAIILIYFAIGFIFRSTLALLLGLIGIINLDELLYNFSTLLFPQFPIFRDAFTLSNIVLYLINVSVDTVTMPIWVIGVTLLYFNQRIRREGFDIEMMTLRQGV